MYISKIFINKCRGITLKEIPLSSEKITHLIVTGKNGSGKTSLLDGIEYLYDNYTFDIAERLKQEKWQQELQLKSNALNSESKTSSLEADLLKVEKEYEERIKAFDIWLEVNSSSGIFVKFGARRHASFDVPPGVLKFDKEQVRLHKVPNQPLSKNFLKYLVNLKAERSFARDDEDFETVRRIDDWFKRFEWYLAKIFNSSSVRLVFVRSNYNFDIEIDGIKKYTFTSLSDGYSSIFDILADLILRISGDNLDLSLLTGVVLIDEIETHLHIDLQKLILPFLTSMFPKLQFIVTTHSPFVITSIPNTVVCDLEKNVITEDLSGYSYDQIIESYFGNDKYSEEVKTKIERLEYLTIKSDRSGNENKELDKLKQYFSELSLKYSPELRSKLLQIELDEILATKTSEKK